MARISLPKNIKNMFNFNKLDITHIIIITIIVLLIVFVVSRYVVRPYCSRILPKCSGPILPFIKEGQFHTTGYIVRENNEIKKTKGTLNLNRTNNGKRLEYTLIYNIQDDVDSIIHRSGYYEIDDYGHVHRIINEITKGNVNDNDEIKHFQHGSATTITEHNVICEGSGSNHMLKRHHPCFNTEIRKVKEDEYEFLIRVDNNIIEYVHW